MTAQLIAPVIPSRAVLLPAGGKTGPVRRLPLAAAAAEAPALPDEVVYGFGRMDVSGRVGDQAVVGVLGWQPGDRLTLTGAAGVVARRDPDGLVSMPVKPYLAIPAALRQRCGLRAGDRVLLAVFPGRRIPRTDWTHPARRTVA